MSFQAGRIISNLLKYLKLSYFLLTSTIRTMYLTRESDFVMDSDDGFLIDYLNQYKVTMKTRNCHCLRCVSVSVVINTFEY